MPTIENFQQILNIHKGELSTVAYKMRYIKTVRDSGRSVKLKIWENEKTVATFKALKHNDMHYTTKEPLKHVSVV